MRFSASRRVAWWLLLPVIGVCALGFQRPAQAYHDTGHHPGGCNVPEPGWLVLAASGGATALAGALLRRVRSR